MSQPHSVVAIIPARAGSRGLPNKNVLPIGGKPLFLWSVDQALEAKSVGTVAVSSDSPEYLALLKTRVSFTHSIIPITRPARLALSKSSQEEVVEHALEHIPGDPDIVVLLQPTSPYRLPGQIDEAVQMVAGGAYDSVVSVVESHALYWLDKLEPDRARYHPSYPMGRPNRQEMSQYEENGSIYVFRVDKFLKFKSRICGRMGLYFMDAWQRFQIDDEDDAVLLDWILTEGPERQKALLHKAWASRSVRS